MSKNDDPQTVPDADHGLKSPHARPDAVSKPGDEPQGLSVSDTPTGRIDVRGRFQLRLPVQPSRLKAAAPSCERREFSFRCSSGKQTAGVWTGIPLETLLGAVSAPPATTHLHVVGADEHAALVPIVAALDGILALQRVDQNPEQRAKQADSSQNRNEIPRVLAPGADSSHMVKQVRSIVGVSLPPDAAPSTGFTDS